MCSLCQFICNHIVKAAVCLPISKNWMNFAIVVKNLCKFMFRLYDSTNYVFSFNIINFMSFFIKICAFLLIGKYNLTSQWTKFKSVTHFIWNHWICHLSRQFICCLYFTELDTKFWEERLSKACMQQMKRTSL